MAEKIRKLANSEVEVLSRIVAECMTGSHMNEIFRECGAETQVMKVQNGKESTTLF